MRRTGKTSAEPAIGSVTLATLNGLLRGAPSSAAIDAQPAAAIAPPSAAPLLFRIERRSMACLLVNESAVKLEAPLRTQRARVRPGEQFDESLRQRRLRRTLRD